MNWLIDIFESKKKRVLNLSVSLALLLTPVSTSASFVPPIPPIVGPNGKPLPPPEFLEPVALVILLVLCGALGGAIVGIIFGGLAKLFRADFDLGDAVEICAFLGGVAAAPYWFFWLEGHETWLGLLVLVAVLGIVGSALFFMLNKESDIVAIIGFALGAAAGIVVWIYW